MKRYRLFVKLKGKWKFLCDLEAKSHREAFRKAMLCLDSDHYDKPIKLEQVEEKMN